MPLAAADLNNFCVNIANFDRQALPEKVSEAELAHRAASPSIYIAFGSQSDSMTFSTLHIDDLIIGQRIHGLDRVLVQLIATAKLTAVPAAPTEEYTMLGDGRRMVVPQR